MLNNPHEYYLSVNFPLIPIEEFHLPKTVIAVTIFKHVQYIAATMYFCFEMRLNEHKYFH